MNLFTLYLIFTVLPNLNTASITLCVLSGIALIIFMVCYVFSTGDDNANDLALCKKIIPKLLILFVPVFILTVLIPSGKQLAYLVSGYVITNTEDIDKLPKNLVDAANKYLEDYKAEDVK